MDVPPVLPCYVYNNNFNFEQSDVYVYLKVLVSLHCGTPLLSLFSVVSPPKGTCMMVRSLALPFCKTVKTRQLASSRFAE